MLCVLCTDDDCRGQEKGPQRDRQRSGALHVSSPQPRQCFLPSSRRAHLQQAPLSSSAGVHTQRISRGHHAKPVQHELVGAFWSCRTLQREHVSLRTAQRDIWAEADELSWALPHLRIKDTFLQRSASEIGRFWGAA